MDTATLLADLRARGIRLRPNGAGLLASPAALLSDADRAAIAAAKPEFVVWLRAEVAQRGDDVAMVEFRVALAAYEASA